MSEEDAVMKDLEEEEQDINQIVIDKFSFKNLKMEEEKFEKRLQKERKLLEKIEIRPSPFGDGELNKRFQNLIELYENVDFNTSFSLMLMFMRDRILKLHGSVTLQFTILEWISSEVGFKNDARSKIPRDLKYLQYLFTKSIIHLAKTRKIVFESYGDFFKKVKYNGIRFTQACDEILSLKNDRSEILKMLLSEEKERTTVEIGYLRYSISREEKQILLIENLLSFFEQDEERSRFVSEEEEEEEGEGEIKAKPIPDVIYNLEFMFNYLKRFHLGMTNHKPIILITTGNRGEIPLDKYIIMEWRHLLSIDYEVGINKNKDQTHADFLVMERIDYDKFFKQKFAVLVAPLEKEGYEFSINVITATYEYYVGNITKFMNIFTEILQKAENPTQRNIYMGIIVNMFEKLGCIDILRQFAKLFKPTVIRFRPLRSDLVFTLNQRQYDRWKLFDSRYIKSGIYYDSSDRNFTINLPEIQLEFILTWIKRMDRGGLELFMKLIKVIIKDENSNNRKLFVEKVYWFVMRYGPIDLADNLDEVINMVYKKIDLPQQGKTKIFQEIYKLIRNMNVNEKTVIVPIKLSLTLKQVRPTLKLRFVIGDYKNIFHWVKNEKIVNKFKFLVEDSIVKRQPLHLFFRLLTLYFVSWVEGHESIDLLNNMQFLFDTLLRLIFKVSGEGKNVVYLNQGRMLMDNDVLRNIFKIHPYEKEKTEVVGKLKFIKKFVKITKIDVKNILESSFVNFIASGIILIDTVDQLLRVFPTYLRNNDNYLRLITTVEFNLGKFFKSNKLTFSSTNLLGLHNRETVRDLLDKSLWSFKIFKGIGI